MGARKIVDEQEVKRWMEEGKTYAWMKEEYERKYNIETSPSLWSNFRLRNGIEPRIVRDDNLIPWHVMPEHRWKYAIKMLRYEARERAGEPLGEAIRHQLGNFRAALDGNNAWAVPVVVHYDPDLPDGFVFVPREAGDDDIIRRPKIKTTPKPRVT